MTSGMIFDPQVFEPEDAAALIEATHQAVTMISDAGPVPRDACLLVAADVMRIARSGYTRTIDGDLDAGAIAEAAALRFKTFSGTP